MIEQVSAAPSLPYPTDEYAPTNANLWEKCLEVARGDRRDFTQGGRTINSPNKGKGYYPWPHPKGIAWAVKQYNGFNGGWKRNKEAASPLLIRAAAGFLATQPGSEEHHETEVLRVRGLVRCASVGAGWHYWAVTYKGARLVRAGLGDDLRRKMDDLLRNFDVETAADLGVWFENNFRIKSPKTPPGGKELKRRADTLIWVLKFRAKSQMGDPAEVHEKARQEIEDLWKTHIEPHLAQLVASFTDEGGKVVPKEIQLGGVTYVNEVGVNEATVEKYAKRLDAIFNSITGWRAKAMKSGLKVVLASPRNFSGTVTGKYKTNEDSLYIRATPNVLKRGGGYASFEYIIVHELGHRYERFDRPPQDFDKTPWWTTRYSRNEGEGFAELFALGHFKLTGSWDSAVVERFEQVMSGGEPARAAV